MRRQSTEVRSQGTRIGSRDEARGALAKRSRTRRLSLEALEQRALLATTPIPVVSNQVQASAGVAGTTINDSSPSIAIDPLDPSKMVAVFTARDTSSGTTQYSAQVTYSTDGGVNWNSADSPFQSQDPTSTTFKLLFDTAEGVGFDRNGNFFVGVLETNNSNAGDVAVDKYSFTGSSPVSFGFSGWGSRGAVYSWDQALTGANLQPGVVNFSMAVDSNVSSYKDPTTGAVQGDPNSGAVYLAMTLNTPPPSPAPSPYNPYTIQVVASSDGVNWPTSGIRGITGSGQAALGFGNIGNQRYAAPQVAISQGKIGGGDGGRVSVIWDDYGTGSSNGANVDYIEYAGLTYSAGQLSASNPGGTVITSTNVRGAQTGTNFPLATPSAPNGIGPQAVIAVDNSLGSFTAFDGRIYVAYVDRSKAAGNPADNTDINLAFSTDDGASWNFDGVVNDDNGLVDGHTSGDGGFGIQGRPQYQPSIAVDTATGTLVMSWLDVRDDASLSRYADYLTTSIDGGSSFSPQTFADPPNRVTDATTNTSFVAGPYSGDESGGNPYAETSTAFGAHQGLAVAGGVVHPIWSTTFFTGFSRLDANLTIATAQASIAAGPRIISGTQGAIATVGFGPGASPGFSSFDVTFDRPVSIASFTPGAVQVKYLNALTGATSAVALAPTSPIVALDPQGAQGLEATQFQVNLAQFQTGVGTYSYSIVGSNIQDLVRTAGATTIVSDPGGTATESASAPVVPQPITDSPAATSTTTSQILVSGVANGIFVASVLPDLTINYPDDSSLTITLTSPAGVAVTLVSKGEATGANFANTAFSDTAPQPLGSGTAPYTGLFKPAQPLAGFANGVVDGEWTLTITDSSNVGNVGSLVTWSLNIATQPSAQPTYGNPTPAPTPILDSPPATSTTTSTITLSGVPPADVVDTGQAVSVSNLTIEYPTAGNTLPPGANPTPLTLLLVSPGGQSQVIAANVGSLTNATITSSLFTGDPVDGVWTLKIIDSNNAGVVGKLVNWSLHVNAGTLVSSTASTGNQMDEHPGLDTIVDGSKQRVGNFFANPAPLEPARDTPFEGPYDTTTLPIVIGGPKLISTFVAAPITGTPLPTVSSIVVSGAPVGDTVQSVTVGGVSLTYRNDANLKLVLIAPNGATATLAQGLAGSNLTGTGFSDSAGTALSAGVAPYTGTFKPSSPLSALAGAPVNGEWSLAVVDTHTGNLLGSLTGWSLSVVPAAAVPSLTYTAPSILPAPITDIPLAASRIVAAGAPAGDTVQSVSVSNVSLTYANDAALSLVLTSPTGQSVTLAAPGSLSGSGLINTGFSDAASTALSAGVAPYTGTFKPSSPLSALAGIPLNGSWVLTVIDSATGASVGSLTGWTLNIVPKTAAPALAYTSPSLIGTSDPAGSAQSGNNLVLNSTVSTIDVRFDQPMDPATFTPGQVLSIFGPTGAINGPFLVTPDPQAGEDPGHPETFQIRFPTQQLSGTYSVRLGSGIRSAGGAAVDANQNAGVNLLFTNAASGSQTVFSNGTQDQTLFLGFNFANTSVTTVPAANNGKIQDFGLTLDVSNPNGDPLTATLSTPGGKTITLFSGITTTSLNNITLTDGAAQPLPNGVSTGTFQPAQSFLTTGGLRNALESGGYTLTISSPTSSTPGFFDIGTLVSWSVNITPTGQTGTPTTFASTQVLPISKADTTATPLVSTITIPAADASLIQDFSVSLNITYPNDPDLTATLTTPGGKVVTLFSGNGSASGSQANFTDTLFNDNAATLIQNGAPPFFGQFKPLQSLLVDGKLLGANESGTYTLTITDSTTGGNSGTLNGWSITVAPQTTTNTGLGEAVADQSAASFRVFTMDPTNPLASNTWTAVGPASNNGQGNSGRVSAIAVDSSDPSGNTVYVAGASGGVWKTTDFLTTSPLGPTYNLLTGNSEGNALNIGSIAVYARNGDPGQSIIIAGTGEGNTAQPGVQGSSTVGTSAGVGFLISYDGGKTWTLDDSLVNYDAQGNELPEAKRDHRFIGTSTYKVIVDPSPEPNSDIIIYAALGGGATGQGSGGLYRSLDSGHTWSQMKTGYATDVVFDPNSGASNAVNNPTGNLQALYAAFLGQGVFLSPNQGNTWNNLTGGVGDPLVLDVPLTGKPAPVPVNAPPLTPTSGGGRIVLGKPALTGNALLDAEYETWLYAAVVTPSGAFNGLFVTKDNGANWTDVRIPDALPGTSTAAQGLDPSNNIGLPNYYLTGGPASGQGNYDIALAVDPTDPNVVYVGGSADFGPTTMIRVDITRLADPYSLYASTETNGGQILPYNTSPVSVPAANLANFSSNLQYSIPDPLSAPYTNLYRNPAAVFQSDSTVFVYDTASFSNDGSGAWYTPFSDFISGTDVHQILTIKDPTTGKSRLLVGYDQGIATGVDNNGTILSSIGTTPLATGVANGNLQITQFYNGAAQPSALAAQIAGALFYGMAQDDGFPTSVPNVLNNGNIEWRGSTGDGTDVVTDQTGTGTTYETQWPCCNQIGPNEFFQVNGVGRTFGLLQSTSVPPGNSLPGTSDPQWPYGPSTNFAVNPIDNQEMIIGSLVGRLFVTIDQGVIWTELAAPTVFDSTIIPALAYGAPDPNATPGTVGNYMMVGTDGGHIYVTFTGGGGGGAGTNNWINISNGLNGAPVQRIVTDPTRGTHDAYAITSSGVFYNANTAAAGTTWVNVTGDLFQQTVTPFGDANLTKQQLLDLGGLAVDWRYVIPFNPKDLTKGTHPMLYVAGVGGVFRSTNNGTNWTSFPDQTLATPVPDGNLPAATVSDLDMVLGNVDPTTGHPDVSTGPNLLLATTYGSGSYGIRLAPIIFNDNVNKVTETQNGSTGVLTFGGLSEQSAYGTAAAVTVEDVTDPNNPIYLGGYNAGDGNITATSPTFNNPANQTNANGIFSIAATYANAPSNGNPFFYDGRRTIALFATDASGTRGNIVSFQITNNLPSPAAPVFVNSAFPYAPLNSAVVSGGTVITTTTAPNFQVTVPNPGVGLTIGVSLIRIDNQGNATTVATTTLGGSASGTTLTGFIQDAKAPVGTFTYEITYTVPIDGQPAVSPVSATTVVKVVPPQTIGLYSPDDSGTIGDGVTNVTQPRFVGTAAPNPNADPNVTLQLVVASSPPGSALPPGTVLASGPDPSSGQYLLQPQVVLPDGTYGLIIRTKDAAGDFVQSTPLTLTISTVGPKIVPTLALVASSVVPTGNPNVTVVRRPSVTGVTDPGATVGIYGSINGGPIVLLAIATASQFKNGSIPAGTYLAQLPSNLTDGTVQLYAFAHNAAGNGNPTPGTLTVQITSAPGDYTGVGRAGLAVYSPGTGNYIFAHAGTAVTSFIYGFGLPNVDIPVPGDYNGDGQTDPAIYRPTNGYWAIDVNSQAAGQYVVFVPPLVPPGPNVTPAQADYEVDGLTDPAVYSIAASGLAYFTVLHNYVTGGATSATQVTQWGITGDVPVAADYDGSGAAQIAVYRPSNGTWYVRSSGLGGGAGTPVNTREPSVVVTAPLAGDVPVPANYDGIISTLPGFTPAPGGVGRVEEAIFRPSNETFYIYDSNTGATRSVTMPRLPGQGSSDVIIPAPADYTGDGKADAAIFDQTLGTYEYINSTTGAVYTQVFFATGQDIPPGAPYQYRVAANTAAPGFSTGGASLGGGPVLAGTVAPAFSVALGSGGPSSGAATAALVIGAPVPAGSTSTGKGSALPTGNVPKAPPIVFTTSSSGSARPAQDAADSAIASLGKSYYGLFL